MRKTWAVGPRGERQENIGRLQVKLIAIAVSVIIMTSAVALGQTSDTNPPQLVEFDFNPKMIDVTAGPQDVTVTARITDDLSGSNVFSLRFRSPTGNIFYGTSVPRTGGSPTDGTYSGIVEIPPYVASGTWRALVSLSDIVGNGLLLSDSNLADASFPAALEVVSIPDTTAPTIADITITPPLINVSNGDEVLTIDLRLADDLSGLDFDSFTFTLTVVSPSGQQRHVVADRDFSLFSEGSTDGIWRANRSLPRYSEDGIWTIEALTLADNAGNRIVLSSADLTDMGFIPTFTVVSAPEDTTAPQLRGLD